jgi:hypothetical protein
VAILGNRLPKNFNHCFENALTIKARQSPFNPALLAQFASHAKPHLTHCDSVLCAILIKESALPCKAKSSRVSRCLSTASKAKQVKRHEKNLSFFGGHFEGNSLVNQGKMSKNTPKKHVTILQLLACFFRANLSIKIKSDCGHKRLWTGNGAPLADGIGGRPQRPLPAIGKWRCHRKGLMELSRGSMIFSGTARYVPFKKNRQSHFIAMQKVLNYLKQNQPRFLAELCAFLRFPSVSAQTKHQEDMRACADWLAQHCQQIGLTAEVCPTAGHPIVVAKTPRVVASVVGKKRPHYLVYGHYDVQPPEPLDLWKSPPFEPRIEGRSLFARGSTDNKGQIFAHLKAVEAYLKTGTALPCDLTFVIEGEEEVGGKNLVEFLKKHRKELNCDAVVVSDTGMPDKKHPALTYALRGIIAFEIILHGPSRDLHSGIFGGAIENPAIALSRMLAQMHDKNGRVAVPHFYDDVAPLSAYERKQFKRLPYKDADLKKLLGVHKLFGERGFL